jgi:hypothetical protein
VAQQDETSGTGGGLVMEQSLIVIQRVVEIHPIVEDMLLEVYEEHWAWCRYEPAHRPMMNVVDLTDLQTEVNSQFWGDLESELIDDVLMSGEWRNYGYTDEIEFFEDAMGGDIEDPELRNMINPTSDENDDLDVYEQVENYLIQYQMFYKDDNGLRNIPIVEVW